MNLEKELAAVRRMAPAELREKYAELFGEPTRCRNKVWLVRRIAWRLQAISAGDISERARRRAAELANDDDLRLGPPKGQELADVTPTHREHRDDRLPLPGTILSRPYKGDFVHVRILEDSFEHAGTMYKTLSAVAKAVTGSHINGFAFFGLGGVKP